MNTILIIVALIAIVYLTLQVISLKSKSNVIWVLNLQYQDVKYNTTRKPSLTMDARDRTTSTPVPVYVENYYFYTFEQAQKFEEKERQRLVIANYSVQSRIRYEYVNTTL